MVFAFADFTLRGAADSLPEAVRRRQHPAPAEQAAAAAVAPVAEPQAHLPRPAPARRVRSAHDERVHGRAAAGLWADRRTRLSRGGRPPPAPGKPREEEGAQGPAPRPAGPALASPPGPVSYASATTSS